MEAKGIKNERRGVPSSVVCYSSAIRPFLNYLDDWRTNFEIKGANIKSRLSEINKKVAARVFGQLSEDNLLETI